MNVKILSSPKDVLKDFVDRQIEQDAIIIDTETTGLINPGVCEISLIDLQGNILLDTLVKPRVSMSHEAREIHGISDQQLDSAPFIEEVFIENKDLFRRPMIAWNWLFDRTALFGSLQTWVKTISDKEKEKYPNPKGECFMRPYSALYGEYCDIRKARKRVRLTKAYEDCMEPITQQHRALSDCQMLKDIFWVVHKSLVDYKIKEVAQIRSS